MNVNTTTCTIRSFIAFTIFALALSPAAVSAQSTTFNYQGKLIQNSLPATGNFDFTFELYDSESGGIPIETQQLTSVPVAAGIFSVELDFGPAFTGPPRWLEISVKPAADFDPPTLLTPRRPINSAPYAIKSLNAESAETAADADNLGGVAASDFVVTTDPRMDDPRPPTPGSADYIQNTMTEQPLSNFDISGTGEAGSFDAATDFKLAGDRVISNQGTFNMFVGSGAGPFNTGDRNAFFGALAGHNNTSGRNNTFLGHAAGFGNTVGNENSFVGIAAGNGSTTGSGNAFLGFFAGSGNTSGSSNAFFGSRAGQSNASGTLNAFFGFNAGMANTGNNNSFFGANAGRANTTGENNSFFGVWAGFNNTTSHHNSFFGRLAGFFTTEGHRNSFYGSAAGHQNTLGIRNSYYGVDTGKTNTVGSNNAFFGISSGQNNIGSDNSFLGADSGLSNIDGSKNTLIGNLADVGSGNLTFATAIGAEATVATSNTVALGRANGSDQVVIPGNLAVLGNLAANGSGLTNLNAANISSGTLSDVRLSSNVALLNTAQTFLGSKTFANSSFFLARPSFTSAGSPFLVSSTTRVNNLNADLLDGLNSTAFLQSVPVPLTLSGDVAWVIRAENADTNGLTFGGWFQSNSTSGRGVVGTAEALTGQAYGVQGQSSSSTGRGVYGIATSPSGLTYGVRGGTVSTSGTGVYGSALAATGTTYGVRGEVSSPNGYAGYFTGGRNYFAGNVGIGTTSPSGKLHVIGDIRVTTLGSSAATHLCWNTSNQISFCSSSIRYKKNIEPFSSGLDLINRLRPVTFNWKEGGMADMGLVAEEVAEVEPLLATYNTEGTIEGVKYDRVGVVLINAVREQQAMIDAQRKTIADQQAEINKLKQRTDAMQKALCGLTNDAALCDGVN